SRSPLQQLNSNDLNELNDEEINGNDETIKKILHGNVFQKCSITFN
ncbi:22235_t:CDS:1, partial [Rhizophagus irregularis]